MTNPYTMFSTEKTFEKEGVLLNYGSFRIRIARAGGSNEAYTRLMESRMKRHRHQIENETIDRKVLEDEIRKVYCETVILGWETRESDAGVEPEVWKPYLLNKVGEKLDFSLETCERVMKDLPDLYKDIRGQADKTALFRKAEEESDAKN